MESVLDDLLSPCLELAEVVDVRCRAAVGVVQVRELLHLERLRSAFVANGVWSRPFGDMIYLTPSLTISQQQLEVLGNVTREVVQEWSSWTR